MLKKSEGIEEHMTTEQDILDLFTKWNDTLATGNPDKVVECYSVNATLLPTISNVIRHTPEERRDYFVDFLALQPIGTIVESSVRVFEDIAVNSGIYSFSLVKDGERVEMPVRFTFVYQQFDGEWLIIEHHSSAMPEG